MRTRTLTSLLAISLIVPMATGCTGDAEDTAPPAETAEAQATDPAAVSQEITRRVDQYVAAWNGSDPAAVAAFFTEDATARVGDDTYTGRQAIQSDWLQSSVPIINNLQRRETRREQRGQDHVVEATYTHAPFETEEGPGGTGGHSNLTWTQGADGQWRIRSAEVIPDAP
jgi:uncharacterized protein (TIGR02246 family)